MVKRYFFREITDFGDETSYWRDVSHIDRRKGTNLFDAQCEFVIQYDDGSILWNQCVSGLSYPPKFEKKSMSEQWFDKVVKPYILSKKDTEKMNPKNYEPKFLQDDSNIDQQGFTFEQLQKYVHDLANEYVLQAVAKHAQIRVEAEGYVFDLGQKVLKHTGDYHAEGTVIGRFKMLNGAIRYAVEHSVPPTGSFIHLYSEKNLKKIEDKK